MNIDIVLPLFVNRLNHGSFQHFRALAQMLQQMKHNVHIRTSNATEFNPVAGHMHWKVELPTGEDICEGLSVTRYPVRNPFSPLCYAQLVKRCWALLVDAWRLREIPFHTDVWALRLLDAKQSHEFACDLYEKAANMATSFEIYSTNVLGPYMPTRRIVLDAKRRNAIIIVGYFPFRLCVDVPKEAARQGVPCFVMPLFHPQDIVHHNRPLQEGCQAATGVLPLSPYGESFFRDIFGVKHVAWVGSAPPPENHYPAEAAKPADPPYFTFFGRNAPSKNLIEAVWITDQVSRRTGKKHTLKVISEKTGAQMNCLPRGSEILEDLSGEKVADVLRQSQALLFPSIHESFGIVAIEALEQKVPVLVRESNLATASLLRMIGAEHMIYQTPEDAVANWVARTEPMPIPDTSLISWEGVAERTIKAISNALPA